MAFEMNMNVIQLPITVGCGKAQPRGLTELCITLLTCQVLNRKCCWLGTGTAVDGPESGRLISSCAAEVPEVPDLAQQLMNFYAS